VRRRRGSGASWGAAFSRFLALCGHRQCGVRCGLQAAPMLFLVLRHCSTTCRVGTNAKIAVVLSIQFTLLPLFPTSVNLPARHNRAAVTRASAAAVSRARRSTGYAFERGEFRLLDETTRAPYSIYLRERGQFLQTIHTHTQKNNQKD
jgi:hypothetical protein